MQVRRGTSEANADHNGEGSLAYGGSRRVRVFGDMLAPSRSGAAPSEFSEITIRDGGRKVLEIRWDTAQSFPVIFTSPATGSVSYWRAVGQIPFD